MSSGMMRVGPLWYSSAPKRLAGIVDIGLFALKWGGV
jgi:hypothetical protein